MVSRVEFAEIATTIERDCRSIRSIRKVIMEIYIELGVTLLAATFYAGVAVGKTFCR